MYPGRRVLNILCSLCLLVSTPCLKADILTDNGRSPDCVPFRQILEPSLIGFAATYFADNTRGTDEPISPESLDPPTAQNLFTLYYGEGASPMNFKKTITRILYSDPGNDELASLPNQAVLLEADRVVLRDNIYTYSRAGSYQLAVEKFGVLLYRGAAEFGGKSWKKYRCFGADERKQMEGIIYTELSRLRNEVGDFQFGQFLGLGSGTTLAFAIDDTGSMGGEIEAAKRRAISIIDERQGSLDQPQNFVLVPFNDPDVGPLTVTHDPDAFKAAINRLYAHGGGDAPELSMRGIQLAVENSNAGSSIFVITDIDAKDIQLQDNVVAQAKQKNIKITFLLTQRVSTSMCLGSWGVGGKVCKNTALKKGYKLYEYIATSTGGRILVVKKNDIFKATEVIETSLKQGLAEIYVKTLKDGNLKDSFPVDSALTELFVQSEGKCDKIIVKGPDNEEVLQKDKVIVDKLTVTRISLNNTYGSYVIEVDRPAGVEGECDITISGRSTKGFVKTLAKRAKNSETGETTNERFEGQAIVGDDVVVFIDEYGKLAGDSTETVVLYDRKSDLTYDFPIADPSLDNYVVRFNEFPATSVMVAIRGTDKHGYAFQRVSPASIEFVPLDIDCSGIRDMVFRAGDTFTANVTIRNVGRKQSFSIEAGDDKGYVVSKTASKIVLDKNGHTVFPVTVSAEKNERTGTVSTVTITASPEKGGELVFKQCRLIVGQKETPDIESFDIVSNINSRFVETSVSSTVYNNATVGRTAEFAVIMPLDSFITEFSMTIDNVTYPGEIEEKEQAKRIFERAKARGYTAGHVAAREKSTRVFQTSVNLEAEKRVMFNLKYQQLLRRSRGKYRHEIIVQTKQPVGKLSVDVYICENRPLTPVQVLGFDTEQSVQPGPIRLPGVTVKQKMTTAHVSFKPTREQQMRLSPLGLNGKFVIEYDVQRQIGKDVNEVIALDRHFVHFFAPELDPMSKRVVFLLDNSASMHGRKMEQVRSAMNIIIDGLNSEDHFAIIMFNSNTTRWVTNSGVSMAPANDANKRLAEKFLMEVKAEGSTNIEAAINGALSVLQEFTNEKEKNHHPTSDYILLLTDGRPTEGKVLASELVDFIDVTNNQTYGIHTIGFGSLVDARTLAKIAARNNGSSIQIFEDIDADLQISDFFETIALPMLRDIEITYNPEKVEATSENFFSVINQGSEVVVAGKLVTEMKKVRRRRRQAFAALFDFTIGGKGKDNVDYKVMPEVEPTTPNTACLEESTQIENFTARLNVFMELQHTLKKISAESNETVKAELKEQALNKSKEFGFVTPGITSMIVLKPDEKKEIDEILAAEEEEKKEMEKEDAEIEVTTLTLPYLEPPRMLSAVGPTVHSLVDGRSHSRYAGSRILSSSPRYEFFGDPHFVVDLAAQVTLCFDWNGDEGQIFNLLYDSDSGITVNGKLAVLEQNLGPKKTFVNELGISLFKKNMTILVTCAEITVVDGDFVTKVSFGENKNLTIGGIRVGVHMFNRFTREVLIKIKKGLLFRVVSRITRESVANLDHLDFSILENEGISASAFGILGQFSRNSGKDKEPVELHTNIGSDEAVMWYRNQVVGVRHKKVTDFKKGRKVDCWKAPKHEELFGKDKSKYIVEGLYDKPKFMTPEKISGPSSMASSDHK